MEKTTRPEINEAVGERQSFQPSAAELQSLTKCLSDPSNRTFWQRSTPVESLDGFVGHRSQDVKACGVRS